MIPEIAKDILLGILVVVNFGIVFWFYTVAKADLVAHNRKMQEIEDDYRKAYDEYKKASLAVVQDEIASTRKYVEFLREFVEDCKKYREENINEKNC